MSRIRELAGFVWAFFAMLTFCAIPIGLLFAAIYAIAVAWRLGS